MPRENFEDVLDRLLTAFTMRSAYVPDKYNPVTMQGLMRATGKTYPRVRQLIAEAQAAGVPIRSDKHGGYWLDVASETAVKETSESRTEDV